MPDDLMDGVADIIARVVQPLAARLAAAETQLAVMAAAAARLETMDARVQDIATKDVGALRERVAVVETRAPLVGPAGKDGKDGRDGLTVDALDVAYDGRRRLTVKLIDGLAAQERTVYLAGLPVYRGVWTAADGYEAGDIVTWSGGAWHCNAVGTSGKPGESTDWTLMVKRGRDGRDGKDVGKDGRP